MASRYMIIYDPKYESDITDINIHDVNHKMEGVIGIFYKFDFLTQYIKYNIDSVEIGRNGNTHKLEGMISRRELEKLMALCELFLSTDDEDERKKYYRLIDGLNKNGKISYTFTVDNSYYLFLRDDFRTLINTLTKNLKKYNFDYKFKITCDL